MILRIAISFFGLSLAFVSTPTVAGAATTNGTYALALAGLVVPYAPALSAAKKLAIARLFNGNVTLVPGAGSLIRPQAAAITCRSGDMAITLHSCALRFGTSTVTLTGRAANELTTTMLAAGVVAQGAAGSMYVGVTGLSCAIAPARIAANDGSGASCTWTQH